VYADPQAHQLLAEHLRDPSISHQRNLTPKQSPAVDPHLQKAVHLRGVSETFVFDTTETPLMSIRIASLLTCFKTRVKIKVSYLDVYNEF
jgi:hypothetical protein